MNTNIGYAVFKKADKIIIDCNGIFNSYDITNNKLFCVLLSINLNKQLFGFIRVSISNNNSPHQNAILVFYLENIKIKNTEGIIGSAIIFKEFQVNNKKVIDGVKYLLSQLKENLEDENDLSDPHLGVVLPSEHKDFHFFKAVQLQSVTLNKTGKYYDKLSKNTENAPKALNAFCTQNSFINTESLVLVTPETIHNPIEHLGYKRIFLDETLKKANWPPALSQKDSKINTLETELKKFRTKLEKANKKEELNKKNQRLYKILLGVSTILLITLAGIFLFSNNKAMSTNISSDSLYSIEETFYVDNKNYNVNIRATPYSDQNNEKAVLSDGDEVYLVGLDKDTFWAKILYNNNNEEGYVSYKYIAPEIKSKRVKPINKQATIYLSDNSELTLYSAPNDTVPRLDKNRSAIILKNNDEIFVKSEFKKVNWYSISVTRNSNIYNGYLEDGPWIVFN